MPNKIKLANYLDGEGGGVGCFFRPIAGELAGEPLGEPCPFRLSVRPLALTESLIRGQTRSNFAIDNWYLVITTSLNKKNKCFIRIRKSRK
jgi:hypothetical protein